MRNCGVTDEALTGFADGVRSDLEDHVFSCEECQAALAEMWESEFDIDVAVPVVSAVRMEWLIRGMVSTGASVATRIFRGMTHYLAGGRP